MIGMRLLTIVLQPTLVIDNSFIQELLSIQYLGPVGSPLTTHVLYGQRENTTFEPSDISRLISPQELLNDVCVNGCARLLQQEFSASTYPHAEHSQRCAILSTFDLPRVRYKCSDQHLWRNLRCSSYWTKDIWILPIHRPSSGGHWVLCIITPHSREAFLFDSLGGHRAWRQNLKVCSVCYINGLITDLLLCTGYHDSRHTYGLPCEQEWPSTPCNH